ncbi:MAG: DUF2723 domain-containing protein [Chloroflexi bacterium]|nr:DUF2723 domain-containing protein [Chloroflexota bacterium]
MRLPQKLTALLPPTALAGILLGFYLDTLAPGLTWANYGSDGGDLITAAATGSVPHPSGYPLYLLLARLFQFLPFGTLAFRTNLLSALAVTAAVVLVYGLAARSLSLADGRPNWAAGLASALAFGLAPLVWSQAVISEVYALHILFVVIILNLSCGVRPDYFTPRRLDLALGVTFGLSLGNHVTTVLLLPLLFSALPDTSRRFAILRRLAWLTGAALLVYLTLPLRAFFDPPINWNDPVTWQGFVSLVSGGLYQGKLLSLAPLEVWERLRSAAGLLLDQAGIVGLVLACLGLIVFFKPTALYRHTLWIAVINLAFALAYGTHDSFVYLIPTCLGFALWIGMGLAGILSVLPPRLARLGPALGLGLAVFLLLLGFSHRPQVDASHDQRAEAFGRQVLALAPADAVIYARGDRAVFTLWYFHFALHERPDVAVISSELLGYDWYQENLASTYPNVQLPGPMSFAERMAALNPGRAACYVEYIDSAQIACYPAQAP